MERRQEAQKAEGDKIAPTMWQQAEAPSPLTWEEALRYAESLTLANHDDWRLPNIKELQSLNEELNTVNSELQSKVNALGLANDDMNNLLAGTGIGTVFVDHQLRIQRFTPAVTQVINLILTDVGRPVGHFHGVGNGEDAGLEPQLPADADVAPVIADGQTEAGGGRCLERALPQSCCRHGCPGSELAERRCDL